MKTFKSSVVLLAILLAAMVIVPMVSTESSTGMAIVASPQPSNDLLNPETLEKLPSFQPGIDDKLSYDEEQRLVKHYVPSPAVPESDMARIIISKSWLLQNDKDPQPDIVQVTFPVTWLTKPDVNDNEDTVIFRLPKKMLELDDTNPDPNMITVSYPETMFEGLSNLNEKDANRPALSSATNQKPAITRAIDRQVRAWVSGQSLVLNYSGEAPLPLGSTSMNQTPVVHISDSGNLISLNYPHHPDLFLFEGNGSRIGNTTVSAEQSPWISSVSIAPDGQDLIATQLVPACCHGSVTNTSSNKAILFTRNGEKSWEYSTYDPPTASWFSDNSQKIFIGTNDGRVICLNRNGTPVWTASTNAPVLSLVSSADNAAIVVTSESNYFGNRLYREPFSPHDLSVLDGDGNVLWQYQTRGVNIAEISKDGSVIAVLDTLSGSLMVFNRSGIRLVERSFAGTPSALAVSGDGNRIVVRTLQGNVYDLDRNGSNIGNFSVTPGSQGIAIDNEDNLVLADGHAVAVYDREENRIAVYPLNSAIQSFDASNDGRSLIVVTEHTLTAFSLNKPDRSSETLPTLIQTPQSSLPREKTSEKATASPLVPIVATGICVAVLAVFRSFH